MKLCRPAAQALKPDGSLHEGRRQSRAWKVEKRKKCRESALRIELDNASQRKGNTGRRPLGESAHYTVMIMEIALVPSLEMR